MSHPPRGQSGFTLFELVVVVIIGGILAAIFLNRAAYYQEAAEKSAMDITVMYMRSGLRLRVAELVMGDRMGEMDKLRHENPIGWLAAPPPNYAGPLRNPASSAIPPGSWYFDSRRGELVYRLQHHHYFKPAQGVEPAIRFRVRAHTQPQATGAGIRVSGLTLTQITPYRWF